MVLSRLLHAVVVCALLSFGSTVHASEVQIAPAGIKVFPSERTVDNPPPNAIDGDLGTFTWSTEVSTTAPSSIALDFGGTFNLTRIRLWKDDDTGSPSGVDGPANLVVTFTTDLGPPELRTWQNVSGLTNGVMECELMQASLVSGNGTVTGDVHDSVNDGHGWASLSFDPVLATGVRIGFSRPSFPNQHYKVHEFGAFATAPAVPAISDWGPHAIILSLLACGTFVLRRGWGKTH